MLLVDLFCSSTEYNMIFTPPHCMIRGPGPESALNLGLLEYFCWCLAVPFTSMLLLAIMQPCAVCSIFSKHRLD